MSYFSLFFDVSRYGRAYDRQRAYLLYGIVTLMVVLFSVYALFIPDQWETHSVTLLEYAQISPFGVLYMALFIGGAVFSYGFLRSGYLTVANWGPVLMWSVFGILVTIFNPGVNSATNAATMIILVLLAGIFQGERGVIGITGLVLLILFLFSNHDSPQTTATISLMLIGSGVLLVAFNRLLRLNRSEGEVLVTQERLKLAEINSILTREASARASLQDVLNLAVNTIIDRYGSIYHAQVFLIGEDGVQSKLIASTGEAGRVLLERGHNLAVGSLSVIGQTTLKGKATLEYSGGDSVHRHNELLPDTAVEAAFPLRVGSEIIGALDLQSKHRNAFNEDDIAQFQSLADSLSLIIDNVRQFEASQRQVNENQRLAEQAREALEEIKRLNKRLIGRAWSEYLRMQTQAGGLNVDFESNSIEQDGRWTATLAQAAQADDFVQTGRVVAVPLRVRGQVIGAMEFELSDDGALNAQDRELIAEISERFGLAAENSRLVEESQRSARREALINQIGARLQANNTIEATLTEAARSLSETLQAGRIAIRLGTPAETQGIAPKHNGHSNGGKDSS